MLCLDFVNTVDLRRSLAVEELHAYDDLVAWALAHDVVDEDGAGDLARRGREDPAGAARELARAVEVREALFEVLSSAVRGAPAPQDPLARVNAALAADASPPQLHPQDGRLALRWGAQASILGPVLRSAAELVSGPELARVRECPGSPGKACGWLFVDRTKNGNRIWCVGAACGNRTRAHRRYRRARGAADG
jgi:predicted RNA-binding Zn ribbon-like protein